MLHCKTAFFEVTRLFRKVIAYKKNVFKNIFLKSKFFALKKKNITVKDKQRF